MGHGKGLLVIAALLVAGLSTAEVPAAASTTTSREVEVILPTAGPGVMSGSIATSSRTVVVHSVASRVVKARAVSIPRGWKSYSYGGVTISVPKTWAVKHNTNCPNTSAPGALLLGYPKTPYHCPAYQYVTSYVTIHGTMGAIPSGGRYRQGEWPECRCRVWVWLSRPSTGSFHRSDFWFSVQAPKPIGSCIRFGVRDPSGRRLKIHRGGAGRGGKNLKASAPVRPWT
jgi:hypothetical protein